MKTLKLFLLLLLVAHYSLGQETCLQDEQDVLDLNSQLTAAYVKADMKFLDGVLAENHVHNNIFGSKMNKAEFLKDISSGILKFISYETPEVDVSVYENVCVLTGLIHAKAQRSGRDIEGDFRFTRIYVKESGTWRVSLFHNTKVMPLPKV